jgi:hypothetical protein
MVDVSFAALLMDTGGVGLALGGAWSLVRTTRLRAPATGTVSEFRFDGEGPVPVIEYVGADGASARFCAAHDGYLLLGQSVPIRYDPRRPQQARVDTLVGSYLRPMLAVLLAPLVVSLAWTIEKRETRVAPLDRVTVYIPLHLSLIELAPCARHSCSAANLARRLDSYDRARLAAEPLASPSVRSRIAELQRSLRLARRGASRPRAAPIAALSAALIAEEDTALNE